MPQKIIIFIVSLALFMESLDATILNTAIPTMSQSLHVNPIDLKIALISYLLSLAIVIPISGWIADKYGVKRVFTIALGIFTLSSLWCGFAHSLLELILTRSLQGIGGALALPVGRLVLLRSFPKNNTISIMSRVVMVAGFGLLLGPVLGGIITHYFSWRWIFWVNIPVGLLAIILAKALFPEMPPQTVPPLDKVGFILFGTSLAGLTFGASALSESTLSLSFALQILLVSIGLLAVYVWHSHKQAHPIVKTELFIYRSFRVSVAGNLVARLGFGGIPFLLPILLQVGLGNSVLTSGLLQAPIAFGILLAKQFTMYLLRVFGYKKLLIINTLLVALSIWAFIAINNKTSFYYIASLMFFYGCLISIQYSAMNSLAYAEIEVNQLSAATSVMGVLQQLSQSFGVAISALLIHLFSRNMNTSFLLTTTIFHEVFFAMGIIILLSTTVFMRLRPEDGRQMIK